MTIITTIAVVTPIAIQVHFRFWYHNLRSNCRLVTMNLCSWRSTLSARSDNSTKFLSRWSVLLFQNFCGSLAPFRPLVTVLLGFSVTASSRGGFLRSTLTQSVDSYTGCFPSPNEILILRPKRHVNELELSTKEGNSAGLRIERLSSAHEIVHLDDFGIGCVKRSGRTVISMTLIHSITRTRTVDNTSAARRP